MYGPGPRSQEQPCCILLTVAQVEYIEQETEVQLFATQEGAPWGLARLSNTEPGSTTYTYDDAAGEGVCAYILDSGIQIDHPVRDEMPKGSCHAS
jgi:subtilisin family serine protease